MEKLIILKGKLPEKHENNDKKQTISLFFNSKEKNKEQKENIENLEGGN